MEEQRNASAEGWLYRSQQSCEFLEFVFDKIYCNSKTAIFTLECMEHGQCLLAWCCLLLCNNLKINLTIISGFIPL